MCLPADERGAQPLGEVGPDVEPARAGAAAEPFDAAADGEVDAEAGDVERDGAGRLVGVQDDMRARLARTCRDGSDVLNLARSEEDMADGNEQRALVDRSHDVAGSRDGDEVGAALGLRLEQVAHGGKVTLHVDDSAPLAAETEARQHDGLGDGDVLVHDRRAGRRPDEPGDLLADRQRDLPPALAPGANPPRAPGSRVVREPALGGTRHRAERVADEVRRVGQERKLLAVVGERLHPGATLLFS